MGLQVWLPLIEDLRNQGLAQSTSFGTTDAFATNGKLGAKSLYSNAQKTATFTELNNVTNFSFAYWIKVDSSIAVSNYDDVIGLQCVVGNTTTTIRGEFSNAAGVHKLYIGKDSTVGGNTNIYYNITSDNNAAKDKWAHLAVVKDNSNVYTYVNGVLTRTTANSNFENSPQKLTGLVYLGNTSLTAAQVNDFRIYDHCLTPEEVKRIAQGLILHYPLNRNGWGQENLVENSYSDWSDWITPTPDSKNQTSYASYVYWPEGYVRANGDKFTCQIEIEFNGVTAGTGGTVAFCMQGNSTSGWVGGNPWAYQVFSGSVLSNGIYKYKWTGSLNATTATDTWLHHGFRADYWGSGKYRYRFIKFEKGEIATPWCPNSSDTAYTTMGLNGTTEYDTSGLGNNGTRYSDHDNLFIGTDFNSSVVSTFTHNFSTNWGALLRYYNGSASIHAFSNGEDTITLNSASNLGISFVRKATDIKLDSNSYYTISCEAKSTQTAQPLCIGLSYYNNSNEWVWRGGTNPTNFTATNTWQKFSLTFKPDADTQYISYCFTVVGASGGTNTFTIRHCKLEKGSVATEWTPGSYGEWTSDTPKYCVSTYFNGSSCIFTELPYLGNEWSYSCWTYSPTSSRGWEGVIMLNTTGGDTDLQLGFYTYPGGNRIQNTANGQWNSGIAWTYGAWHHFCGTFDGSSLKTYIDGNLVDTKSITNSLLERHMLTIGARRSGTNTYNTWFQGNLSDVRIYATALSATDVKSLYQNCATIGPDGTIYGKIRS